MSDAAQLKAESETERAVRLAAQKRRNVWLALALVGFVALVGVTTVLRLQSADFSESGRLYFSGYLDEAAVEKEEREARALAEARAQEAARLNEVNETAEAEPLKDGDEE